MIFDYSEMRDHAKKHKLSFKQYKARYLNPKDPEYIPEQLRKPRDPEGQPKCSRIPPQDPEVSLEDSVINNEGTEVKDTTEPVPKVKRKPTMISIKKKDLEETATKGRIVCKVCQVAVVSSRFKRHLRHQHTMDFQEYYNYHTRNLPTYTVQSVHNNKVKISIRKKKPKTTNPMSETDSKSEVKSAGPEVASPEAPKGTDKFNFIDKDGRVFSDVLAEQCVFMCEICQTSMPRYVAYM